MMVPMTSFKRRHPPGIVVNRDPCDLESSRIRPSNNTTSKVATRVRPIFLISPSRPLLPSGYVIYIWMKVAEQPECWQGVPG